MSLYKGTTLISGIVPDTANQSLSNLNSAGQAIIDGKVSKTGDTMTGQLTIHRGANDKLMLKDSRITRSTVPSSAQYSYMRYVDKDENSLAGMYYRYGTNGDQSLRLYCTSSDGESSASLYIGFDSSGTAYCSFPKCTTKATTTSTATTARVAVITQNYNSGASWYRVWSDGWIEQGGSTTNTGTSNVTVSLLQSFSNKNYTVIISFLGDTERNESPSANKTAVNKFTIIHNANVNSFGWYACGY